MGLDMYLTRRTYVSPDERKNIKVTGIKKPIDPAKVEYITEEVGYWRKANAIHRWFVENVQEGEDDCKSYTVSREQLQELLATVNKVLDASKLVKGKVGNGYTYEKDASGQMVRKPIMEDGQYIADPTVAKELLPRQEGFFFGGLGYDQWYVEDLKETQKILTDALSDEDDGYYSDYQYQSSW